MVSSTYHRGDKEEFMVIFSILMVNMFEILNSLWLTFNTTRSRYSLPKSRWSRSSSTAAHLEIVRVACSFLQGRDKKTSPIKCFLLHVHQQFHSNIDHHISVNQNANDLFITLFCSSCYSCLFPCYAQWRNDSLSVVSKMLPPFPKTWIRHGTLPNQYHFVTTKSLLHWTTLDCIAQRSNHYYRNIFLCYKAAWACASAVTEIQDLNARFNWCARTKLTHLQQKLSLTDRKSVV